ncbi:MAG: O-antigen polysaccharide polymerase Wzy [Microcoleus anatoxicus]|uniref:O-antigen polysaccharide polymerase Wzy n=1 Tax=Microcoleus anatoxicus TaxID=2705319 RepID=UPI00366B5222
MDTAKTVKLDQGSLIIILGQFCIHAILIISCILYEPLNFQTESLIYPSSCFLLLLTLWVFWSWSFITKSLFDPYILFFIAALLFNGGQIILEIFSLNENGILDNKFSTETILKTIFLVDIGLASFHLGALISAAKTRKINCSINNSKKATTNSTTRNTYLIGFCLLGISFFPAIVVLRQAISVVASGGYFGLYEQEIGTSFSAAPSVLAGFLVPSAIFILAGSKEKMKGRLISGCIIVIYSATKFFLGERNQAVMPLLAFASLWHKSISPLPKTFLLSTGSLIMFIVFPLVAATRNVSGKDRLSIDFLVETFSSINNPALTSLSEMGGSMMTVAHTIDLVPSIRGFQMGAEYFYALLTLMPNFFGKIHPTIARGIPDVWLVWEIEPEFAARGGSFGFSFIAEAYLNFGWFGAPIALGVMGFLFAKFTLWAARSGEAARMATVASYTSFFLFFARAESALVVRSLVWYSLCPYFSVCLLGWLKSNKLTR